MKRSVIEKCMADGTEVAWVRSENWGAYFGVIESTTAERRVYHGSRDFRGSIVKDGIQIKLSTGRVGIVPANQVKDAAEVRAMEQAKVDRRAKQEESSATSKATCEHAVATINAVLEENGVKGKCYVRAVYKDFFAYGMTYSVEMSGHVAATLASVLA